MKRLPLILLVVAAAGFAGGLAHLFRLRFAAGDIYPPYSSLRADPLGTKALHDALQQLLPVRRHFQSRDRLGDGRGATLFLLGTDPDQLTLAFGDYQPLEQFVARGGRLVIALSPAYEQPHAGLRQKPDPAEPREPAEPSGDAPGTSEPEGSGDRERKRDAQQPAQALTERWGFRLAHAPPARDDHENLQPAWARLETEAQLPETLPVRTGWYFAEPGPAWRVIYALPEQRPVAIERSFQDGTIVLLAESYTFSNEALRQERAPAWLAWVVGGSSRAIFDEAHLGVEERPGVANLARKYRLHGLGLALLVLAALFIWQNTATFLPPEAGYEEQAPDTEVAGKTAAAGFENLLRRNIPPKDLLALCVGAWKKSCARDATPARLQAVEALARTAAAQDRPDPVRLYLEICRALKHKPGTAAATATKNWDREGRRAERLSASADPGPAATDHTQSHGI